MTIPSFPAVQVEQLARCLAQAKSHSQLTDLFAELGMDAPGPSQGAKWLRIREALAARQKRDGVGNNVGTFVQTVLSPVNFVKASEGYYERLRAEVNLILAFCGLHVDEAGKLCPVPLARTLDEAARRASELRAKLVQRAVHPEVLSFCRPELLDGNYFHAVLEASKSVADKVRNKTGLPCDGAELFQRAFGGKAPLLAINTLTTDTEKSEQAGFANLLVGLFGTFRNPTAHAPKVHWPMSEQDALDLLSLVSYVHRRLDGAVSTNPTLVGT